MRTVLTDVSSLSPLAAQDLCTTEHFRARRRGRAEGVSPQSRRCDRELHRAQALNAIGSRRSVFSVVISEARPLRVLAVAACRHTKENMYDRVAIIHGLEDLIGLGLCGVLHNMRCARSGYRVPDGSQGLACAGSRYGLSLGHMHTPTPSWRSHVCFSDSPGGYIPRTSLRIQGEGENEHR